MPNIFMVEDDDSIRELVLYALGKDFDAAGFPSPAAFWQGLKTGTPDLLLLDIMLPGQDGLSVLKTLKADKKTARIPIILLTAKGAEYDRVKGLDAGADDYITKPFSVLELISRVNAVLRRSGARTDTSLADGAEAGEPYTPLRVQNVTLDTEKHLVTVDGRETALTYKEFELLRLLMEHRGAVLTREKILSQIWDIDFEGESRTVDMHIKTLRQKLGAGGEVIHTVRGVGYKAE
ncbi:MAG: response regulator transcription factor [Oscillospiraceae bacterium]|nr:response regulator transcription factor [Oscillospiraceae bacterium]